MAFSIMTSVLVPASLFPTIAIAQPELPAYAKWSRMAIEETKKKYPKAHIIDYLHVGSESRSNTTTERFKLWLKEGDKEFGVYVSIKFITQTGNLVTIEFQETSK